VSAQLKRAEKRAARQQIAGGSDGPAPDPPKDRPYDVGAKDHQDWITAVLPNGDTVVDTLVLYVRNGYHPWRAARTLGMPMPTWSVWKRKASEGREPFATVMRKIYEAEGHFQGRHLTQLNGASHTDPAISRWFLERRFPKEWGGLRPSLDVRTTSMMNVSLGFTALLEQAHAEILQAESTPAPPADPRLDGWEEEIGPDRPRLDPDNGQPPA
jgi:hypothetical protein